MADGFSSSDDELGDIYSGSKTSTTKNQLETDLKRKGKFACAQRPAKRPNLVGPQSIVVVKVSAEGHDEQLFRGHKNYICHYSAYFKAAFEGNFIEGSTQELTLEDIRPYIFGVFVAWLYDQTIQDADGEMPNAGDLGALWVLADRIMAPGLANITLVTLEARRQLDHGKLSTSFLGYIYDNTTENSPLRRYLVDAALYTSHGSLQDSDDYPRAMLFDMVNCMLNEKHLWKYTLFPKWEPQLRTLEQDYFLPVEGDNVVEGDRVAQENDDIDKFGLNAGSSRQVLKLLQGEPPNNESLHINVIASRLKMMNAEARKAGDELLGSGFIYTTVDDDTWAALE